MSALSSRRMESNFPWNFLMFHPWRQRRRLNSEIKARQNAGVSLLQVIRKGSAGRACSVSYGAELRPERTGYAKNLYDTYQHYYEQLRVKAWCQSSWTVKRGGKVGMTLAMKVMAAWALARLICLRVISERQKMIFKGWANRHQR